MSKRDLGSALVLILLVAACSSPSEVPSHEPSAPVLIAHSDRLEALAGEMATIAAKKAWYGKYFTGVLHGAWAQGPDLFLEVFDPDERRFEAYRIDLRTGTPRWRVVLGPRPSKFSPLAGDHFVVFVLDQGGGLVVVTRREGNHVGGLRTPLHLIPAGSAGSSDSTVYIPSLVDRRLHAVNPVDGASGWGFRTAGTLTGAPVVTPRQPRRLVVVASDQGEVVALPPAAWNEVPPQRPSWARRLLGEVTGPMTVAEHTLAGRQTASVLVPCQDKGLYCLDGATGEPRWVYRTGAPFGPQGAVVAAGRVFARNARRLCVIDLATGQDAWGPADAGGTLRPFETCSGVLAADAARAYLAAGDKHVLRVDGATGQVLMEASLPSFDLLLGTGEVDLLLGLTRDGHIVAFH